MGNHRTEEQMADWRDHPDYEEGYSDVMFGRHTKRMGSEPYTAGWDAAKWAKRALSDAGFADSGDGRFRASASVKRADR
jgi:hypothetical protein